MRFIKVFLIFLFCVNSALAAEKTGARASLRAEAAPGSPVAETFNDIRITLGIVPDFFKRFPAQALPGAWQVFKNVQLNPSSAVPGKYKELTGLAVAAQIPCRYCSMFHTDAAKLNGASTGELEEAVALAASERQWSTMMAGSAADPDELKRMADTLSQKLKGGQIKLDMNQNPPATPEQAYSEIESVFGFVPQFARNFPREGIAGAWTEFKMISLNPDAAIPPKYRDLISLAVSSQIPCPECISFDTACARAEGASDAEINEAIAMAALTRHWSTVINGSQLDETTFKRETAQIMKYLKKKQA